MRRKRISPICPTKLYFTNQKDKNFLNIFFVIVLISFADILEIFIKNRACNTISEYINSFSVQTRRIVAGRPLSNPNPKIYIGAKWIKITISL